MIALFKRRDGVTLVEALVSILMLQVFLCVILCAFLIGKMCIAAAKHRVEALNILREKTEELKNTLYKGIISADTSVSIDIGPDLEKGTSDDLMGTLAVTVADKLGYKEITVNLTWTDVGFGKSRDVSENLVTYINAWSKYSR